MKKLSIALISAGLLFGANAVKSKDGLGDFLIAPVYFAKNNTCTNITVYNTNTTHSIIAKVAIREQIASNEVDFPIFLSPGDVWSGTLCQKADGDVYLNSTDDSNHPQIATLLATTGKDITKQSAIAGNTNVDFTTGYIEVYPIAEFDEGSDKKVDKAILVKRWDNLIKGEIPANTLKNGVDGYSLAGKVSFETDNKTYSSLPMVAYKGCKEDLITGSAIAYGNDTGPSILFGTKKRFELLKIMQHKKVAFTYTNYGKDQYIVFTYPFGYAKDQLRKFKFTVRDMQENKDKAESVIFSPAPKAVANFMKNEVAIISVADLINKTKNPSKYESGQIQIEDITNVSDVQLGAGEYASFIPTLVTFDKNNKNHKTILDAYYIPVK